MTVVPSAAALVIKALKEPPRDRKKVKNIKHSGNVTQDDIINAARIMRPRSMAKEFSGRFRFYYDNWNVIGIFDHETEILAFRGFLICSESLFRVIRANTLDLFICFIHRKLGIHHSMLLSRPVSVKISVQKAEEN